MRPSASGPPQSSDPKRRAAAHSKNVSNSVRGGSSRATPRSISAIVLIAFLQPHLAEAQLDYNRDADANSRKAKLRLDTAEGARSTRKGEITPIVPGKPEESELIARIFSTDPDEQMPPPDHPRPLDEAQRAILKQWIEEGAEYKGHWALLVMRGHTSAP